MTSIARIAGVAGAAVLSLMILPGSGTAQQKTSTPAAIRVPLAYGAPRDSQPRPNFSPKGTAVQLTDAPSTLQLPEGAVRPAKVGLIKVGPDSKSWVPVLATSSAAWPQDLVHLYLDRNRNGVFTDDGPSLDATPSQNAKTKAWWSSMNKVELTVPYSTTHATEPYLVNFWLVRDDSAPAPDVLRYSTNSWRYGKATVNGVNALVAAMDEDNDALFGPGDMWSVIPADQPNAARAVLSLNEARETGRFMFLLKNGKDMVLEFRSFSPDGRSVEFEVVPKAITKVADRAPDDQLRDERPRPRAAVPFAWDSTGAELGGALARASREGRYTVLDFETTWCGPCHSMDQWIWTDAEVAGVLNNGYVGVKLDGDIEKALVKKYNVAGYPTIIILDSKGTEVKRAVGYVGSRDMLGMLGKG